MSAYDPELHHRRSIRLPGYDYTQPGAYFVTLCTHERAPLFGAVVDGQMVFNTFGKIVREEWFKTAEIRPYLALHDEECVVMPNHIHGIIWIVDDPVGATRRVAPTSEPRGP
ncbi:MAG: transposase, partial [Synergistales bacterium]|nr:transposase [Synergistales bacterium]